MRERTWGRRDDGAMQVSVLQTSRDRAWNGFVATLYDETAGFTRTERFPNHNVSMLVGTPVPHTTRCDGAVAQRLRVAGDIDVVPAGYGSAWVNDGPTAFLVVNISPSLIETVADAMAVGSGRASLAPQLQIRDPQLEHICWALKAELETVEPFGRLYAESLGVALAAHLLRRYAPVAPRRMENGLPKRRLQRVIEYIHAHVAGDLTLSELAEIANLSPSHFKLLFKLSFGVPVHQYVMRTRVEYAIRLLSSGMQPLCDVALQSGFANQSHMARCVRRATGLSPGDVRRGQ